MLKTKVIFFIPLLEFKTGSIQKLPSASENPTNH